MALKINLTNSKGQNCGYHKIGAVSQIYAGDNIGIVINIISYTNQDYREKDEKEMVISTTNLFLSFLENEDYSKANLYNRIKAEISDFSQAEDC